MFKVFRKSFTVALVLALSPNANAVTTSLQLEPCRLASGTARATVEARCGWFDVAENREDAKSKRVRIHVAVVPALRKQALPDPVVVISGGPGQGASDFYLSSANAFESLRRDRDVVVIDQRGTGKSQRLDCKLPDELETERFDKALLQRFTRECLEKLPGDPRFYSTSVAVRDLDEIRAALGYVQINLYGISYGTRVAQHYLRRYPKQVRAVVLDGVVPVETILGPEIAPAAQRSLDTILARCASDSACNKSFPNLATEFRSLRSKLENQSIPVTLPDPRTAKTHTLQFSATHLAIAVRLLSYADETASLLPFLIHEAANGRPQSLAAQALLVSQSIGSQIANGMHNAVVCTEDVPFMRLEALSDPAITQSYLGPIFTEALQAACEIWPKGEMDSDFHAPLLSDVPTLLLSGQNDPVTPSSFGELASKSFTKGKHWVFPGQGHGQFGSYCGNRLLTRFIESLASESVGDCVAQMSPAPFMLDANGPSP